MSLCDSYCLIIKYLYSMERKYITINELKKVLSAKEMKNVLGGSVPGNCTSCPSDCHLCHCTTGAGAWYQCGTGNEVANWACGENPNGPNVACN